MLIGGGGTHAITGSGDTRSEDRESSVPGDFITEESVRGKSKYDVPTGGVNLKEDASILCTVQERRGQNDTKWDDVT